MLQKSKSDRKSLIKMGIVVPFLAAFFLFFNIKTNAQQKNAPQTTEENATDTYSELLITSLTSDEKIKNGIQLFKQQYDIELNIDVANRDAAGNITSMAVKFRSKKSNGSYSSDNDSYPIKPLIIYAEKEDGNVTCGFKQPGDNNKSGIDLATLNSTSNNAVTVKKYKQERTNNHVGYVVIRNQPTDDKEERFSNANPLIIVNGKVKGENFDLKTINPNNIESINVLKDAGAITKYGSKANEGAIEITLKKN